MEATVVNVMSALRGLVLDIPKRTDGQLVVVNTVTRSAVSRRVRRARFNGMMITNPKSNAFLTAVLVGAAG